MSSNTYSAELTPDPFLRRVVILSSLATTALGSVIILLLPISLLWRVAATVVWLSKNGHDLSLISKGHKRCRRIRISHDGGITIMTQGGVWAPASLVAGSVVLSRCAWLRFEFDDGHRCAELLRGCARENKQWRRLQVIWRHL